MIVMQVTMVLPQHLWHFWKLLLAAVWPSYSSSALLPCQALWQPCWIHPWPVCGEPLQRLPYELLHDSIRGVCTADAAWQA